jgi:hypothetical protein
MKTTGRKSSKPQKVFGWLLFLIGIGMLGAGLGYDATVQSGPLGLKRTYNVGKINTKQTYTNTGGFLAVCGAIFITKEPKKEENNDQSNENQ